MKFAALALFAACASPPIETGKEVRSAERIDTRAANPWYPGPRAPLETAQLVKLPVGAIEPRGWLRKQLELQMDGFHGHLGGISKFLEKRGNAWLDADGAGDHGWEEVPYWIKGFGDCAYLLNDPERIAEARGWIEGALASQRADGYFGPRGAKSTVSSTEGEWDLWPNMPMLDALRSWHEFTGDERVLPFLARYFRWELALPDAQFVPPYWQHLRAYDNLWSVYWLLARIEDEELRRDLLALGEKIYRCAARWEDGVIDWHNVNVLQGFGGPTFFAMQSRDEHQRGAAERNFREFREKYGQVPGGLFGSDENARPGFTDPRQAVETCGMVEFMFSCERLLVATGELAWADRCEDVAFNSLPAATTADLRALRYLTAPNQATSDRRSHSPGLANGGPMFCFDPHDHRCCQHNFGHGWPYLAEHTWMATADSGAALVFPLASVARLRVGASGARVELECASTYPFSTEVEIVVRASEPVRFPLYVRVPGWSTAVDAGVGAKDVECLGTGAGPLVRFEREWNGEQRVRVSFGSRRIVRRWPGNANAATIEWGPLTYSLATPFETMRSGGTDAWPAWEVLPTGPWNYAFELGHDGDPVVRAEPREYPADHAVWDPERVPLRFAARARLVPSWRLDRHGLVAPLAPSPVRADERIDEVALIPMGAARLRISAFPIAGGPDANEFPPQPVPPHPNWKVSASHCFASDSPEACLDGDEPASSRDSSIARLTWWPRKGTGEWVSYAFDAPLRVTASSVYWFDDSGSGGCAVPLRWRLLFEDAEGTWREVPNASYDEPKPDAWCAARFDAVTAKSLRLDVDLRPEKSGGVLEWRVETVP